MNVHEWSPWQEKFPSAQERKLPSQVKQGNTLSSYVSSHTPNKCLLPTLSSVAFFTAFIQCLYFLLAISLFQLVPQVVLKCCLVFPSARRLMCSEPRSRHSSPAPININHNLSDWYIWGRHWATHLVYTNMSIYTCMYMNTHLKSAKKSSVNSHDYLADLKAKNCY